MMVDSMCLRAFLRSYAAMGAYMESHPNQNVALYRRVKALLMHSANGLHGGCSSEELEDAFVFGLFCKEYEASGIERGSDVAHRVAQHKMNISSASGLRHQCER